VETRFGESLTKGNSRFQLRFGDEGRPRNGTAFFAQITFEAEAGVRQLPPDRVDQHKGGRQQSAQGRSVFTVPPECRNQAACGLSCKQIQSSVTWKHGQPGTVVSISNRKEDIPFKIRRRSSAFELKKCVCGMSSWDGGIGIVDGESSVPGHGGLLGLPQQDRPTIHM
jgi:hypothetical protein